MNQDWSRWLTRWTEAGLIDQAAADRIRLFEHARAGSTRLAWPILLALAFGALMIGGGLLLFVAAHWDRLSPGQRFTIVLVVVGGLHAAGAALADRFHGMAMALHATGTICLGGGIALAGQIFNLEEHWPGGIMLWALGAGAAWAVLRHASQMALFAVLAPAWLAAEWVTAAMKASDFRSPVRVLAVGSFLLALTYFSAALREQPSVERRVLVWIGAILLLPLCAALSAVAGLSPEVARAEMGMGWLVLGWTLALALPLALAVSLRRFEAWPIAVAAVWALALLWLSDPLGDIASYGWWGLGAVGLVAWGLRDARVERINMGAALLAITIVAFYFSHVMDKLGRSGSLVGMGLLFLLGGWALERARRRLVLQVRETES